MTTKVVVVKAAEEMLNEGEDEEVDVIGMKSKQMIVSVLVLSLLPKQKKRQSKKREDKESKQKEVVKKAAARLVANKKE